MKPLLRASAFLAPTLLFAGYACAQNPASASSVVPSSQLETQNSKLETSSIPTPLIPPANFTITEFGAIPDGTTVNTAAIQKTIAACAAAGGGTVIVPAGKFLTGPITLASSLNFHLAENATLLFINDPATFPKTNGGGRAQNCISVNNGHDIEISGPGVIDGQGAPWWKAFRAHDPSLPHRPNLVSISNCTTVLIHETTFRNSPQFHLVPQRCTNVTIRDLSISAPPDSPNTDAMDPSGWHFLITNVTTDIGDDNVAIKAGGRPGDRPSCQDFTITNCTMLHGHGLSIGSETSGGLDGLYVSNCTFNGTTSGIRLKSNRTAGGLIKNLHYSNLTMTNVEHPIYITSYYPTDPKTPSDIPPTLADPTPIAGPIWRDMFFSNITITNCPSAGTLCGLPEIPIGNLTFDNVHITANTGMTIYLADNVTFTNSTITAQEGPPLLLYKATVTGLAGSPAPLGAKSAN